MSLVLLSLLPTLYGEDTNTKEGKDALKNDHGPNAGQHNSAFGFDALYNNTLGSDNTGIGFDALATNKGGSDNVAVGSQALVGNTTGDANTANGFQALLSNTTGVHNTGIGLAALAANTNGAYNTGIGSEALVSNTTGSENTATGLQALYSNTTGRNNTADGLGALLNNTTGEENTANGFAAMAENTRGSANAVNGFWALHNNTNGYGNTANGWEALISNTTGAGNTGNGWEVLFLNTTGRFNTADGLGALYNNSTGNYNTALGVNAGYNLTTGDNNIDIGNFNLSTSSSSDIAGQSDTIRIGHPSVHTATYIAGIRGITTGNANALAVVIDSAGQLGTISSSARFKKEIKPIGDASESLLQLKPVTFYYKNDNQGIPQFGLVAEEVARVNPNLVVRDEKGDIYTVRYEAVNAMLLNEFLKEHRQVQAQQKEMDELKAQLKEQAAAIQKISARLEFRQRSRQVAIDR